VAIGPLVPWRLWTVYLAAFVTTAWLVIGIRGRPASIPVASLWLLIPAAGFWFYTVEGGPEPSARVVGALVFGLYAIAVLALLVSVVRRSRPGDTIALGALDRKVARGLLVRLLVTLWMSALLVEFEPPFAIAYLVVNALWELVWIPRRSRTSVFTDVHDIAAPRQDVFAFIANPVNWPRYFDDVEVLDVQPPGPLGTGSRYRAMVPNVDIRGLTQRRIEVSIAVLEVIPGRSISSAPVARPADVTVTEVGDAPRGSRVTTHVRGISTFIQASQGVMFRVPMERARFKQTLDKRMARLKAIIEPRAAGP
jgi:hypothetical protein